MKTCLIRQPAGLGDIFFCLKIGYYYNSLGYKVIWPVLDHFMFLIDYLKDCPITFLPLSDKIENKELINTDTPIYTSDFIYLPLQVSSYNIKGPIMQSKYKLANIDNFLNWADYFNFKRDLNKEKILFYDKLGLNDEIEYTLTNNIYASLPNTLVLNKEFNTRNKVIKLEIMDSFTIFDWSLVIEKAKEIHTVGTSICLIIEKLSTCNNLHYYKRPQEDLYNFTNEKILFKKPWNFYDKL